MTLFQAKDGKQEDVEENNNHNEEDDCNEEEESDLEETAIGKLLRLLLQIFGRYSCC